MRQPFQISSSATPWTNQPITEKVIAVSTSASDGSKNLVLQGTVSGSPDGETITFGSEGRIEKESTKTYEALISASLSASAAGTVRIYRQGVKASGTVIVSTNPTTGDTWTIGLVGNTRNYKFVSKGQSTILCVAASAITTGDYFDLVLSGGSTARFWYNKSGGGGAPSDPGGGLTVIAIGGSDTASQVATATEAVLEAVSNLTCTVDTATVTVNYDIWGTMAFTDGNTTHTFTAISPGYADAANNVTIGATAADTAANLNKAINDTGTEGTHYGTGTTINEYLSSTVSGSIVTILDKIACDRYLGWTTTQSGTGLSLSGLTGGVNGSILGTIGVGTTGVQDALTLDNETLDAATANFPGTITPTFDAIRVGGTPFRVFAARGTGSNVVFKIMGGHSSTTCTEEILTGLTAGSSTYEMKPVVATAAPSGFEYIQPICTSNGNSSPIQLAAYVVSG